MNLRSRLRPGFRFLSLFVLAAGLAFAATTADLKPEAPAATAARGAGATGSITPARKLEPPTGLGLEIRALVQLLEAAHYNRDAVTKDNYGELIPDFMESLDGQRLFFLETDKQDFMTRHPADNLYNNISYLGHIDPAYEIFAVYESRVQARVAWIMTELDKDIDLTGHDTYAPDRSKSAWPADAAAADDLWRRRLKFDLIQEMLSPQATAAATPANPDPKSKTVKPAPAAPATKSLAEAKEILRKRYGLLPKNVADIDASDLAESFLTAITQLYDPHSTYFSASTYEDFGIQMRLQLVGIGALLSVEDDYCVVKELVPGGPADLSKPIKPNDKITAIAQDNGEPVDVIGMKLRNIVRMIRGAKGTNVHLTVESGEGAAATRKVVVLGRDIVNLDSARAHAAVFSVPAADGKSTVPIGVITLPGFYGPDSATEGADPATASKDVAELIKRLQTSHIQGLVLDLRQNGGGLLSEAVDLTGLFIKSGPVVQVRDHEGKIKVDSADEPALAWSGPLAVLVSRFSASASEIVAGALQNYGRAVIIGDSSTHGKGTVQTIVEMSRAFPPQLAALFSDEKTGATKLTIQKFYLPDGSSTQLKGVVPDIILPSVDEYLPIGESSLPHALAWDKIDPSKFNGHVLDPDTLAALRSASTARQNKLPEFSYLDRSIAWFKARQDAKNLSLNLKERQQQMDTDAAYKKTSDAELKNLEKSSSYPFTEVMLAPPPPPRIKAEPADPTASPDDLGEDDSGERYAKMDIDLRESLRVVQDALHLNPEPRQWVLDAAPTAQATTTPVNPAAVAR